MARRNRSTPSGSLCPAAHRRKCGKLAGALAPGDNVDRQPYLTA